MKGAKEVQEQQNAKYDSIQFGTANRVKRLQEEGRVVVEEVLDVEGNALGGKKAAMQYGHDLRVKEDNTEEPLEENEEEKKLEPLEEFLGIKEEMEKLASLLDQARENAMDSGEKDAAEDEQEKKQRLLEKMTKEQPKEGIDMDTDKDLSDAHEEKAKEASENLQKREA